MKLNYFNILSVFFISLFTISVSMAQDEQAQMKAWQDYMTPGPQHEMLSKMAGDWTAEAKMWQMPGSEPMEFEGTAHFEMILGGRYLSSKYEATMMGMPFTGMQIDAYDNIKKEFITIWIDNMGTGIMVLKGRMDENAKSITYTGTSVDPMTGNDADVKTVLKFLDDNNYIFEMFMVNGEEEFKSMEMHYTRK